MTTHSRVRGAYFWGGEKPLRREFVRPAASAYPGADELHQRASGKTNSRKLNYLRPSVG
jgi:hypothetical protein